MPSVIHLQIPPPSSGMLNVLTNNYAIWQKENNKSQTNDNNPTVSIYMDPNACFSWVITLK